MRAGTDDPKLFKVQIVQRDVHGLGYFGCFAELDFNTNYESNLRSADRQADRFVLPRSFHAEFRGGVCKAKVRGARYKKKGLRLTVEG